MINRGRLLCAAPLAALFVFAPGATVAQAGTYTVYSCHTPSGRAVSVDGWRAQNTIGVAPSITSSNDCNISDGALHAHLTGGGFARWRVNDSAAWVFRAPAGTTISGFRAAVCTYPVAIGVGAVISWPEERFPSPQGLQAVYGVGTGSLGCVGSPGWQTPANYVSSSGMSTPALWFSVICTTGINLCENDENGYAGFFHVYAFAATLSDLTAPSVSAVSGSLAANATHQGTETVMFNAADQGAGVYRAVAEARVNNAGEWRTLTTQVVDANNGRCVPNGETGSAYEFDALKPCRPEVAGATLELDTTQLPAGDHTLRVVVEDAAGNRTDVIPARIFHVDGLNDLATPSAAPHAATMLPATNGVGASRTALLRLSGPAQRRIRYGSQMTVSGQLFDAHSEPIAGAVIQVQGRPLIPKTGQGIGDWSTLGQVTTTKTGAFTARLPAGTSRNVLFVYRANAADTGWTSTAQTDVVVAAKVSLRAKRSRVRNRHSAVFIGRIRGQVPQAGVLVTLQVAQGSKWIPVATNRQAVRSDRHGRFRLSYRFLRTTRRATFTFRVLANQDSAFPYDEGYSQAVNIHVRP